MTITIEEGEIKVLFQPDEKENVGRLVEFILKEFPNDYQYSKEPYRQPAKETKILKFE